MKKNAWKIVIRRLGALAVAAILVVSVPSCGAVQVQAAVQARPESGRQSAVQARPELGRQAAVQARSESGRQAVSPRMDRFLKGWIIPKGRMNISPHLSWTRPWRILNWL